MNTREILHKFSEGTGVQLLETALAEKNASVYLKGVAGSGTSLVAASIIQKLQTPSLFILSNKEEAIYFKSDLEHLLGGEHVLFLPESFVKPFKLDTEHALSIQERTETINLLRKNSKRPVVTYLAALAELCVTSEELSKNTFEFQVQQEMDLDFLLEFLEENGFTREDFVYEPGQFSIRGGILDLYSFAHDHPYRVELDGRTIESIRTFDVVTQLSIKEMGFFSLVPNIVNREVIKKRDSIFHYFPENTLVWVQNLQFQLDHLAKGWENALQTYVSASDSGSESIPPHPKEILETPLTLKSTISNFKNIHFGSEYFNEVIKEVNFNHAPQPLFHRNFELLISWMKEHAAEGYQTLVFSENSKQIDRLYTIFNDLSAHLQFIPIYQGLAQGFVDHDSKLVFATEHQLFDKFYRPKSKQSFSKNTALTLKELRNLNPGDFVTHIDHGIGRFAGLEKMEMNGVQQEVVRIVYKDNDLLYVSVNSLHKIAKYTGKDGTAPTLHKLGSPAWDKQKKNTKKKVKDIARELIHLYARRKAQNGVAFPPDNYLQIELEAGFFYEDTPDQAKATDDVKRDMEKTSPMDRLVCGDVGFGKTEVAIRAAFKAVCNSKQVAVLVPTTILAHQHYRTFSNRLRGFPVNIDYLNRFKSSAEQKATLKRVEEGNVDIVIGTHRLLSKDIKFKDLGLLVIDEEQKFGVSAKEKLKELRVNVDTLTLTATPIPRTLHFSLMGARDLSIINTPPPNRQPVHTELRVFSKELISQAIYEEIQRGGQVFFIHHRVKDIHEMAHMIEEICPGVRVCVAHGQMEGDALENTMVKFIEGEYDVLVATTIIESGLDIPNANTIIINQSHMFGLSDLHQMRGRVGRSNIKAYCYLLAPPLSVLTDDARKRLRTLEEFHDLGSGFQVAMRDLDIRGAGNLLGAEQSGFISEMGFEMYHKILDEAVRELKNEEFGELFEKEEDFSSKECQIETDFEMLIPSHYVENIAERLSLYNELANINTEWALQEFARALTDRFGKLPEEVIRLIDTVRLKWAGKQLGLEKIVLGQHRLKLYFPSDQNAPIYMSEAFSKIMQFVADSPQKFTLKQTDKALILNVQGISTVYEAIYLLNEIHSDVSISEHKVNFIQN